MFASILLRTFLMPALYKLKHPQFWLLFIMGIKLDPMK